MTGKVFAQTGDDLSEVNINEAAALANQADYVVYGLDLDPDYTNLSLSVMTGFCTILESQQLYRVFPDAATKTLSDNTVHEVFVRIDSSVDDDVSIVLTTDGSTPTDPHLKIGEVDTNTNEKTELNRDPDGTFETVTTDDLNNTIYASNNISGLPSIQEGLDLLESDTDGPRSLTIVGGENVITQQLNLSGRGFRDSIGGISRVSLSTAGGSWLKVDPGLNNSAAVLVGGTVADIDITIDGNIRNGATAMPAILLSGNRTSSRVIADIYDADEGVVLQNNSERIHVNLYAEKCNVGLRESENDSSSGSTGMNHIAIRGRDNQKDMVVDPDPAAATGFRTHPMIFSEQCNNVGLHVKNNAQVTLRASTIRIANQAARVESGARLNLMGSWLTGNGSGAVVKVDGGGALNATNSGIGFGDYGIQAGTDSESGPVNVTNPFFYDINTADIDAADSKGQLRYPTQVSAPTTVKVGDTTAGTSTAWQVHGSGTLANASIDVQQGRCPVYLWDAISDTERSAYPATEGSRIFYNRTAAAPEYYDGADWRSVIDGSVT